MAEHIQTDIYSDGEETLQVIRRTRDQHARQAEKILTVVEEMGEMFTEDVEQTDATENALRLTLLAVTTQRALVHATLAGAASEFNLGPDAEEDIVDAEEVDTSRQHDVATDRVDPFDDPDTDRPGAYL